MGKEMIGELELNRIYQRDCIEGMRMLPDKSIDMILCDLPYGTTKCKWDEVIPFELLWGQYERIIKDNGAIVLTAAQPFTSSLVMSNPKLFRYSLVWEKSKSTGFLNSKKMPLRSHEDILVFYKKLPIYNPQMTIGLPYDKGVRKKQDKEDIYGGYKQSHVKSPGLRFPRSVIYKKTAESEGTTFHKTQKPVALFEYLIRTFSNENNIVLDNCIGSGTTAVAAIRLNRNFIGFETNSEYVEIAKQRLETTKRGSSLKEDFHDE
ncbi:DNA-methyltransferase [Bacillus safensis]